ncbi:L-2-hydroxyglutarate oxidase [Paracoccus aerodenitrificans]|uniref:L-2-hydroxyglutarate oxidase n=1 Tax=Paracoccus aerodenitrificans TaxID=3017781 RepID=UPI0022F0891C|nr:L-2-hydroxyglutarate oxidase [Paracoccus aerodenitrificans]WBU62472.1 L-2-hydroxyglutarate oxidase [Paracoccus aerodenitrificans]
MKMTARLFDYVIIGAGIVGAALGAELTRRKPGVRILIAEKESRPAFHQTGRNSGVVHSGVYYTPGSLKARFCREGLEETRAYCAAHDIGYDPRGKLIVATNDLEASRLSGLQTRAAENGVQANLIDADQLRRQEPNIAGVGALHIPATAIVDYTGVTRALLAEVENAGGDIQFNAPVTAVKATSSGYAIEVGGETVTTGRVIACTGLASDRVARLLGIDPGIRILPFRGEYFVLPAALNTVVHSMIYPVPDPNLPFLGVHLTPMIDGTITVGPNAVLSLAREKYGRFSIDPRDALSALSYSGLWRTLAKHPMATLQELKGSLFKSAYLNQVQKYCPQIKLGDLGAYRSANRAQAVRPDGTLVDDFLIKSNGGLTTVLNAPSPAATSAMPIARYIADQL